MSPHSCETNLVIKAHSNSNTPIIGLVATDTDQSIHVGTKGRCKHLPKLRLNICLPVLR